MNGHPPACLLCGAPLPPWNPDDPDPEEFERTLICLRHPLGDLLQEGLPLYRCDELCIAKVQAETLNKCVTRCWVTSGYFSLLIELEDHGLLRVYPSHRWPDVIYFDGHRRCPGSPQGLVSLSRENLGGIRGPCDPLPPKAGLEELFEVTEERAKVVFLEKPADSLVIGFSGREGSSNRELTIEAVGWTGGVFAEPGDVHQAVDLCLSWSLVTSRAPR